MKVNLKPQNERLGKAKAFLGSLLTNFQEGLKITWVGLKNIYAKFRTLWPNFKSAIKRAVLKFGQVIFLLFAGALMIALVFYSSFSASDEEQYLGTFVFLLACIVASVIYLAYRRKRGRVPEKKAWRLDFDWFLDRWGGSLLLLAVLVWIVMIGFNPTFAFELVVYIAISVISIMAYVVIFGFVVGLIKDALPKREEKKKERRFGYRSKTRRYGYR